MPPERLRIAFIITDLFTGGAEMMLYKLLSRIDRQHFDVCVISLAGDGPISEQIRALDVPVENAGMRPGLPDPRVALRLSQQLRHFAPHLVQTWMYHADLVGGLAARLAGRVPVCWSVRNHSLEKGAIKRSTRLVVQTCALLSHVIPARVIMNSESARRVHVAAGYDARRMLVIPNGFDLKTFHPDEQARSEVRAELGLQPDTPLVGLFARFDPVKDHRNFVFAAAQIHHQMPQARFMLCGSEVDASNSQLAAWIDRETGLRPSVRLLGPRDDMPRLTAALDVAVVSSYGEAFPNVLGEAMACGVPCVATDVGDCRDIIGDTGRVVAARQPEALAAACLELLNLPRVQRMEMGQAARRRIETQYKLEFITARYEELYRQLAGEVSV